MGLIIDSQMPSGIGVSVAGTPLTYSFTNTAGTVLYVCTVSGKPGKPVTGVTYAGEAMTSVKTQISHDGITGATASIWRKLNPATGANDVVVTGTDTTSVLISGAISFTGNHATTPDVQSVSNKGNSGATTVTATGTVSGNYVIDCACCGSSMGASAQTASWLKNVNTSDYGNNGAGSYALSSGGNVTMGYANAGDGWAVVAVEVGAAASAAVTGPFPVFRPDLP